MSLCWDTCCASVCGSESSQVSLSKRQLSFTFNDTARQSALLLWLEAAQRLREAACCGERLRVGRKARLCPERGVR